MSTDIYENAERFLPRNIRKLVTGEHLRAHWQEDGAQFWYEGETLDGYDYYLVDPDALTRRHLVDREAVAAALAEATGIPQDPQTLRLSGFSYDFDSGDIHFQAGEKRWRYLPDSADIIEAPAPEAEPAPPPGLSPDGRWRAFIEDHNLYLEKTATSEVRQLTEDGSAERPYARPIPHPLTLLAQGISDPEVTPSISWSPDSRRFVTFQMDLEDVPQISFTQSTPPDDGAPIVYNYVYPLAGQENVPTTLSYIFDAETGERTTVDLEPTVILSTYGAGYSWTSDSEEIIYLQAARGFQSVSLHAVDAETGASRILTEESSDTFINYYMLYQAYRPESDAIFWTSDQTGWRHAYMIERNGERRALTSGEWEFAYIAGADGRDENFYLVGNGRESGRDPYLRHLYRVSREGGEPVLLTHEPLEHRISMSPDTRYFVDNMSLVDTPTRSVLRRSSDGAIIMELQQADASRLAATGYHLPEPFETVSPDGETPIHGVIFRPANFDPARNYPVIDNIYAGPQQVMAPKSFTAGLGYRRIGELAQSLAQLGFIVVQVDGRGTSGRGRDFLNHAYQNLHAVGLDDHVAALRQLGEQYPYMDLSRVGIFGLSAGGFDTVRAMLRYPEFYRVGVSAAGNHDNRLNQAYWSEIWMGNASDELFYQNSNPAWADHFEGELLLVQGETDESVPLMAAHRMIAALIEANKDFEYLLIPNATHFLNQNDYYIRRMWDFFIRELQDAEPPPQYRIGSGEGDDGAS